MYVTGRSTRERAPNAACTVSGWVGRFVTAAGWIPAGVGRAIGAFGVSGGAWTVLRTTELVALRHEAFRRLTFEVDHVVALCQWVKQLLLRNGVPASKITVSRQGLWRVSGPREDQAVTRQAGELPLRIMFLGRLDPSKGAHVLIEAVKSAPELRAVLAVYGVVQGDSNRAYLERLIHLAAGDSRIRFHDAIPSETVVSEMQGYDVLAVPSQGLETGPLVVMEAFAAGIPVIGSKLGGIEELITDRVDGLLIKPDSIDAWRAALEVLCRDHDLLPGLRGGVQQPRHITDVASDMSQIYTDAFAARASGGSTAGWYLREVLNVKGYTRAES